MSTHRREPAHLTTNQWDTMILISCLYLFLIQIQLVRELLLNTIMKPVVQIDDALIEGSAQSSTWVI